MGKMAQLRASSDKSKADKAKAEVQAVTATIINIDTGKNPNKKAKKVLLKRLAGTKKSSQEDMRTGREKASAARDATIKAKVDKAAEESIKVRIARRRASSEEAKAAKAKAELQSMAATLITLSQYIPNKKISKKLVKRLSATKKNTIEELKAKTQKITTARKSAIKAKVDKAAEESKKVKAAKSRASTIKAIVKSASPTVIDINIEKDSTKKSEKGFSGKIEY